MEDLRIEVVDILGFCDQPMQIGDYFEIKGGKLYIPDDKYFCMWALQSVLPMLPAKQRELNEENDWLRHTVRVACPDPNGRVILEIQPTNESSDDSQEPAQMSLPERMLVSEGDCTGCRRCELACSFEKTDNYNRYQSRISVVKCDVNQTDEPHVCRQCGRCMCVEICPNEALGRDPETHAVVVQSDRCEGCGACAAACPFDSVKLSKQGYPLICDLCGGEPMCVRKCPTGAVRFGTAQTQKDNRVAKAMFGDMGGEGVESEDN